MKYVARSDESRIVEVLEFTADGYAKFKTNGLEVLVSKKRFLKVYKEMK